MNAVTPAAPVAPMTEEQWKEHRAAAMNSLPEELAGQPLPAVLIGYQARLLEATLLNQVTICEKSRRIGATWGIASLAVLTSGAEKKAGGMDSMYIGYNMDMAREFVDSCAMWARAFMPASAAVDEYLFADQDEHGKVDRHIQAFRIRFASGFEIVALSSKPRSLRGRQGFLIFDEAAFHDDLDEMMKAALAFLIWGGKILVISTHNGEDNAFNELIKDARSGKKPYKVVRVTFDDAIKDGLFKRICLVGGKPWSQEEEDKFVASVRAFYGDHAGEELDAVPTQGSGVYLSRAQIEACSKKDIPVVRLTCPSEFSQQSDELRKSFVEAWCDEHLKPLIARLDPTLRHCFGEDFGRVGDLTVLWFLAILSNLVRRTPFVVELRNVPFVQQEQILKYIVDRLPRFTFGALDARGNGAYLAERAAQKYGALAIEQVQLSERWYIDHMPKFKSHIEERTFEIPADSNVVDDIRALKLIKGVARIPERVNAGTKDQRHGDAAIAGALAIYASYQGGSPIDFQTVDRGPLPEGASDYLGFASSDYVSGDFVRM